MSTKKKEQITYLTPQARQNLEGMEEVITQLENSLKAMKELGFDVEETESKLAWAKKARAKLLKDF